jgi:hypothetical protein
MTSILAAQIVAYGTCLFLLPFFLKAYFDPMSRLSLASIGLVPSESDRITGLSNIRGSVGGLRLAIIAMIAIGTYFERPDLALGAAILVGAVALGRFVSLGMDGWNWLSFATASGEVVIVVSLLHIGGFV